LILVKLSSTDMPMGRTTKIIGFSVPPTLVREVERLAKEERRTKSELFREMLRVYDRYRKQRERDEERWVMQVIREAQEEERTNPMTTEQLLAEEKRLARYGARQAKKLGIKQKDIDRIIHESRAKNPA